LPLSKLAGSDPQKIIMVSDEHFLGPILAHDNFCWLPGKKKPAFLAIVGYVKEAVNP
jgi:hypothetical protein